MTGWVVRMRHCKHLGAASQLLTIREISPPPCPSPTLVVAVLSDVTGVLLQAGYSSGNDGAQAVQADKTEGRVCSSSGV